MLNEFTGGYLNDLSAGPLTPFMNQRLCDLNDRMTRLENYMTTASQKIVETLPERVVELLHNSCQVNAPVPATTAQVRELLNDFKDAMRREFHNLANSSNKEQNATADVGNLNSSPTHKTYTWDGRLHLVPKDFQMPHV